MSLEIILWFVAWVVLSEGFFIFIYCYDEWDTWYLPKLYCFLFGGVFILIQFVIVFPPVGVEEELVSHYIHLLYEVIVIAVIVALFYGNSLISKKIDECRKKKNSKKKK